MSYEDFCDSAYDYSCVESREEEERRRFREEFESLFHDLEDMLTSKEELPLAGIEYVLDEMSILLDCKRSNQAVFITRPKVA